MNSCREEWMLRNRVWAWNDRSNTHLFDRTYTFSDRLCSWLRRWISSHRKWESMSLAELARTWTSVTGIRTWYRMISTSLELLLLVTPCCQQEPLNMNHVCSNLLIRHSLWRKMNAVYVCLWSSITDYTTCQVFMKCSLGIIQKLLNIGAFCENQLSNIFYLGGKWIYAHIFHISWSVWVKLDK